MSLVCTEGKVYLININILFRQADLFKDFGNGINGCDPHVPRFNA